MANLGKYNYKAGDYGILLGHDLIDASAGNQTLKPDPNLRTIIIGVGGTGVRTLDQIKGTIQNNFDPTWKQYIGFLGIDASWSELDNAHYLDRKAEGICTTLKDVTQRMQNVRTYPLAVRRFMLDSNPPGIPVNLGPLSSDGAAMTRLIGKVKVHDQVPGEDGTDEKIVQKLQNIITSLDQLPAAAAGGAPSFYDVYVIGSGSGGTGSGSMLEMPSLIRKALGGNSSHIYGILYLPDTLTGLNPSAAGELKANGYATLKELNYFQGMYMREGYQEVWTYNNPASPELKFGYDPGFFDLPYLIGSPGAGSANASAIAGKTIAQFLVSMLIEATPIPGVTPFLTSAFYSNAVAVGPRNDKATSTANSNEEAAGTSHEFPKCFASLGFAEAAAPKKIVRAYAVKEVCKQAGIKPVSPEDRTAMAAQGATFLPFRDSTDLLNATVGTQKATELIQPIADILQVIHNGSFNFIQDQNLAPDSVTWETVKANTYSTPAIAQRTNTVIAGRTNAASIDQLSNFIKGKYDEFRKNVREYVAAEGPYAFVNLFYGRFTEVGNNKGLGIKAMLDNLVAGKQINGANYQRKSVQEAANDMIAAKKAIDTTPRKLFDVHGQRNTQLNAWLDAYNEWAAARINEKRAEAALGISGLLQQEFVNPAGVLADQMEVFGNMLVSLANIYSRYGQSMNSFNQFAGAAQSETEVNIAAVNQSSYQWLKKQADQSIAQVRASEFRNNLVNGFFDAPDAWLEVPDHLVRTEAGGSISLVTPDKPVPARELFDAFVTKQIPLDVDVSILSLFQELQRQGTSFQTTADYILQNLATKSQVRFNGTVDGRYVHKYIKYPNSLNTASGNGPAVVAAITAAAGAYGVASTAIYPSAETDTIKFYQQATNLEVYRIHDIKDWEDEYEARAHTHPVLLHGKSPDVEKLVSPNGEISYKEYQSWVDYPSIVQRDHPEKPDPVTGVICHEGQVRLAQADLIEKARRLGVLFSQQVPGGGWYVYRVNCDMTRQWTFNVVACMPDPATGLLPQGRSLAEAVAQQNDVPFDSMTRPVTMNSAGIFSQPASSEDYAWRNAARVLRAHHPMLCEVRRTCEKFAAWDALVEQFNVKVKARMRPAKMIYLLKGGVVYRNEDNQWLWKKADGSVQMIVNLSPAMYSFITPDERVQIENGLLSYYLFKCLDKTMAGEIMDNECNRAKQIYNNWMNTQDLVRLQEGQVFVDIVEQERQALAAKGAGDGSKPVSPAFRQNMVQFGYSDAELQEIEKFYHTTTLWGKV
ncbi:MAG: tubulin-like doman-containing protein [Clostridiales bacterium]|nr:tubulin-like doman-containing protein [Clostridiales bacterium]